MSYIRKCSIIAEGASTIELSEMRCRFEISQTMLGLPNMCYLRVTNLSPETAAPFHDKEYKTLTVSAGYRDGPYGVIFQGDITQGALGRETQTDTLLTIVAHDGGNAKTSTALNTTLAAGSTPKDHVDAAVKAMAPAGISKGYIGPDLSQPKYPRSVTLYAMASTVLDRIAHSAEAVWSIQNGKLTMFKKKDDNLPGDIIELSPHTGLIGMPAQEIGAVWARCLINPSIKIGTQVHLRKDLINELVVPVDQVVGYPNPAPESNFNIPQLPAAGIYTVFEIDIDGDTRGLPWYMDLHMLAKGQAPTERATAFQFPGG